MPSRPSQFDEGTKTHLTNNCMIQTPRATSTRGQEGEREAANAGSGGGFKEEEAPHFTRKLFLRGFCPGCFIWNFVRCGAGF